MVRNEKGTQSIGLGFILLLIISILVLMLGGGSILNIQDILDSSKVSIPTSILPEPSTKVYATTLGTTEIMFPRAGEDPAPRLVKLYNSTKTSLDIAIYSLTHPSVVEAILSAKKRGVNVRIISDKVQAAGATQKHAINALLDANVPTKVNTHSGLMHLKVSISDSTWCSFGSYNYSKGASEDNDECFVLVNDPQVVTLFINEFNRLWTNPTGFKMAERSY